MRKPRRKNDEEAVMMGMRRLKNVLLIEEPFDAAVWVWNMGEGEEVGRSAAKTIGQKNGQSRRWGQIHKMDSRQAKGR
jgi:hypothetical protein